nr:hypothetical protein [Tanacetum cinerariifolium]
MNWLNVDTLTPDLLAGPTYELMRGSCTSLTELEYHLEEVYKATTDQLDWVNPEGQQYPDNLLQPLPLIPDNRGRRVIPFEHFINNDLEYLRGGTSSRKYTTLVTKTKAADYGHIKWIEDLVPCAMWIQQPIDYNKHALWGVSHWGRKRKQFYGYAVNQESALDVYSKRRIIAITELKIVEWHDYKHLDWITVRRDDDKIYKFKEGDLKRLRWKTMPAVHGSIQPWISELAKQADTRSSFNELMDTPLDFSNFLINRLKMDTLTPELLAGPTYELIKGSCKSLVEREYYLEEVFKATTDQLDWVNPEGQQCPHNLLKP